MKLMMIDGNSIINRAFYGIRMLNAPDGTPTNGVYGFISILQKLLNEEKPDGVCVAFDLRAKTFRHLQYEGYKAQRKGMPEELAVQMPILKELLDAMGICRVEKEGYEADDLIGTVSRACQSQGTECVIVTGDKDSFQLIGENVRVKHVKSRMGKTETIDYTEERFREEYGFAPINMIDLKALMGDASDNIPGVAGVGEKTAMDLIQRYGSIEYIYNNFDSIEAKPAVLKKLQEGAEMANMSYELATIITDAPIDMKVSDAMHTGCKPELYGICKRLGFEKYIEQWGLEKPREETEQCAAEALPRISISGDEELRELLEKLKKAEAAAVYPVEGLDALEICDGSGVYSLSFAESGFFYNDFLRELFSAKVRKIGENIKDLIRALLAEGVQPEGFIFDTALAGYLLDATGSDYSAARLSIGYCGREISGAEALYCLRGVLENKLNEQGMGKLYYEIELPLCRVLADMEHEGFLVDRKALYDFGESLNATITALQQSIYDMAGEEFNINSPKQLGVVLFEKLMLPAGKKTKTGWSTNADILEKLRDKHPIINEILDYRMLTKLKSTYADGLLKVIEPDGRIRTSFQMTVTATGRLSSTEPNLQNIPVRKELGAQIRKMFVAAPGKVLVDADYSQIELRLLAHISGDEAMTSAFNSGGDIHTHTASQVFGLPLDEVTPVHRSRAKAVNFGIVYGISSWSLAQDIGVFPGEAKAYMDAYLEKYHGVRDYQKNIVEKARDLGYVETLYGRRRALPELKSSNFNMRAFGERVALNMPIQGTAADIIKLAMVNVYRRLKEEKLKSKLILQVHDELIAECPEEEAQRVMEIISGEMEAVAALSVPLTAEAKKGRSWADAH